MKKWFAFKQFIIAGKECQQISQQKKSDNQSISAFTPFSIDAKSKIASQKDSTEDKNINYSIECSFSVFTFLNLHRQADRFDDNPDTITYTYSTDQNHKDRERKKM